jgi:DNA cross-link repair 1A protein
VSLPVHLRFVRATVLFNVEPRRGLGRNSSILTHMFRNPRGNAEVAAEAKLLPSIGRPPTPPTFPPPKRNPKISAPMPTKPIPAKARPTKGTPVKLKQPANGNILTFFKKAEELQDNLFVRDRYNELGGANKRRKTQEFGLDIQEVDEQDGSEAFTPPPPADPLFAPVKEDDKEKVDTPVVRKSNGRTTRRAGPFVEESDSEDEGDASTARSVASRSFDSLRHGSSASNERPVMVISKQSLFDNPEEVDDLYAAPEESPVVPHLKREETSYADFGDIEGFENIQDFDDDEFPDEGEEIMERRYIAEQLKLQMSDGTYEGDLDDEAVMQNLSQIETRDSDESVETGEDVAKCPICSSELRGVTDEQASVHVNNCLDGNPTPLPVAEIKSEASTPKLAPRKPPLNLRQARPGQVNPILLTPKVSGSASAFEKLMSGHAEDIAWKTAAAAQKDSRGKPAFERTCPFYKIMPDMSICVDAFRYGAVEGCKAYFLSHFHSDHYIGLTASWKHGPIYCSKVTGNLVKQQLKVDPKYVVDLEFEGERDVPGTPGVRVTMIPANHCPGSSLFLFEKPLTKGSNPKKKRILHCGDFRACRTHVEHPLLRPDVQCHITGKTKEQKIDVCYLDTTYLNPKFAFPDQESVIKACADMCISLSKASVDDTDNWETMKRQRAGTGMVQFLQNGTENIKQEDVEPTDGASTKQRGRLLVVVGTYSIGKERICLGIAKALNSKIYCSAGKQRICAALEDPELMALLTSNPKEAQIHMTPLFEIRADTLDEYLKDYRDTFTRAVAFRPSGWNYRPPNSRFTESPSVQTVLHSQNWKSVYSMRELKPQPGSTKRATCYGVPYSEHSSFRELSMFCCALRIEKIVPTVNVGSAKSRERMKLWIDRWTQDRRKNGLFKADDFE